VEIYNTVALLTKLSILLFINRLFLRSRLWDYAFYTLYGFFGALWVASFFDTMFSCRPVAVSWDLRVLAANKGGRCVDQKSNGYAFSAIFAATDVLLLVLPLSVVSKLPLQLAQKIGVLFLFSLGALSCALCIWKAVLLRALHGTDYSCKRHSNPISFGRSLNRSSINRSAPEI
jgi:hypothetical protein